MHGFWRGKADGHRSAVSADFEHALTREILSTERLRVKAILVFVVLELSVLRLINQRLAQGLDVPYARRYLSALIETSLPTIALYLQMSEMGPTQALAFVAPLVYFIFIILSTLRLDFWLSTFTGLVASAELFGMAIFYHPAQFADDPAPDVGFHLVRC